HVISLDATMDQGLSKEDITTLFTGSNPTLDVIKDLLMTSVKTEGLNFPPFAFVHDALALLYTIDSDVVKGDYYSISIETEGKYTYGRTVVDMFGITNAKKRFFTTGINKERFIELLKEKIAVYS
ncbi:MAG: nucleoside hydrolase, partial [Bacillota bacterium]